MAADAPLTDADELGRRAREQLRLALRQRGDRRWIRVVTLPAPTASAEQLAAIFGAPPPLRAPGPAAPARAVLWLPPAAPLGLALGAAWEVELGGEQRFDQLLAHLRVLLPRIVLEPWGGGVAGPPPRLYGGAAFAPGAAREAPWRPFGDGRFLLPRWSYLRDGGRACLQAAVRGDGAEGEALLAELESLLAALAAPPGPRRLPRAAVVEQLPPAAWDALVRGALAAIAAGSCAKIVAARRCVVEAATALDATALLRRLLRDQAGCTVLALRSGPACLVGATPERLVARRGDEVRTEALAGTAPAGPRALRGDAAAALATSAKDLAEHELVVRDLVERLAPHCAALPPPAAPVARALRDMIHLHTPLAGRLRRPTHVVELVRVLHPTPATAGRPAPAATRWILESEPCARGWYAGPVGWFDTSGDGDFAVALRSGVLLGRRAYLYAGAGLVPGSDPRREYEETALKQRALLAALGALEEAPAGALEGALS